MHPVTELERGRLHHHVLVPSFSERMPVQEHGIAKGQKAVFVI